jgi:hypothetical protein
VTLPPSHVPRIVSLLLNPSLLTGIFFMILSWRYEQAPEERLRAASIAVTFATLLPIGSLFALVKVGKLSDVEMRHRDERHTAYNVCLISYALGTVLLMAFGSSWPVWGFMALHVPNTIVLSVLNRRWKVSIHTTVIAGLCAAGIVFFGWTAVPALLLLLAAAWARWAAGAHSSRELLLGVALGAVASTTGLILLRSLVGR